MKNTQTAKHTILWADDDQDDMDLFREVLRDHAPDHKLVEFGDGYQLLTYLKGINKEDHPCLIVLDMNMPVLSGRETLSRIKNEPVLKDIPVVVFTTSISPVDKDICDKYQTNMFTKPPSYYQLKTTVDSLVDLRNKSYVVSSGSN